MFIFGIPVTPQTALIGAIIVAIFIRIQKLTQSSSGGQPAKEGDIPTPEQCLKLITSRRSIMPKDLNGETVTTEQLQTILEAANWAPTHKRCEPWRYTIISGPEAINRYLDFLDVWYLDHSDIVTEDEAETFRLKLVNVRTEWPDKVSHVLLIGMKRQALPDKRLPEWEEICSVATSVQNMHLMTTSMNRVGGFWSSHTWCKAARDAPEIRQDYFPGLLEHPEDRVFGAFLLGKYDEGKSFRSKRTPIADKIHTTSK